jgi:hypothetical protein
MCEADRPAGIHEIREKHLTSRIRVGTDHDPNHSKERSIHWGADMLDLCSDGIANLR